MKGDKMSTIKKIEIKNTSGNYDSNNIGAEPENVAVYKNTSGQYVNSDATGTKTTSTLTSELNVINNNLNTFIGDVAPIEDGTNYSKTYNKEDQFVRNGLLYKVTASTVTTSTAINTGSGGNATLADCVTEQLNDLKSDLTNNYIIKSRSAITVTADGVKTYKTLLNDLANALVSAANGLASNEYLVPLCYNNGTFYSVCENNTALLPNANSCNYEFSITRIYTDAVVYFYVIATTPDACTAKHCNISDGTITDDRTNIVSSGHKYSINYEIRKKL